MPEIGYALSSEEHSPNDLVRYAQRAEESGFTFALVSDHYHPWNERQGNSPFAWSVLGAIAHATQRLRVGTGVTCPLLRYHPTIIAQAAATTAAMMPGRFFLGLGTGENLNEHVIGEHWPTADLRRSMLAEAIEVIRLLWQGELTEYYGAYYTVENAKLYTLPPVAPQIMVAAGGPESADLAARLGDGLISTGPDKALLAAFDEAGGKGKPKMGQIGVCWANTADEARRTAREWWPQALLGGELLQELRLPRDFEQASKLVSEDMLARAILCGADARRHIERIEQYAAAGYDHVYIHQIGPDQEGFFRFYQQEVLPHFQKSRETGGLT